MFTAFKILVGLPFIFFIPGYVTLTSFLRKKPPVFFLHVLLSILITSITGLTLAIFGCFSLWLLTLLLAVYSLLVIVVRRPQFRSDAFPSIKISRGTILLGVIFAAGIFLFFQPFEYILGGWDPGVYVNTGVNIAKTGSICIRDEFLKTLAPDDQKVFYHIRHDMLQKYPGFIVTDPEEGLIAPYFYHLYPVWIAIFYSLFGTKFCLFVNPVFAILSVFGVYLVGRELFNEKVGLLSAFLLTINIAQMWQARFPTTEILTQFLIFGGIYSLALFTKGKGNFFGIVSALCFGEALLARITVILLLPPILIFFYCRAFEKFRRRDLFFIVPFFVMIFSILLYDLTVARVPTKFLLGNFQFILVHRNAFLTITGLVLIVLAVAKFYSSRIIKPISSFLVNPAFRKFVMGFILLLGVYGYFIRPNVIRGSDAANLVELGWFLSPVGLLLGMVGILWLTYRALSHDRLLFYLIVLTVSIFFLHNKMVHPTYMWAVRRFVPVIIPGITILASFAIFSVLPVFGKTGKILAIAGACYLALFPAISGRHIIRHRDYPSAVDFCDRLGSMFADTDILVCDGYWLATPLQYIYGKSTLQISDQGASGAIRKCKRAEELMLGWLEDGKDVFYITDKKEVFPRFLNFTLINEKKLDTHLLERTGRYPKRIRKFDPIVRVFKVDRAGECEAEKPFDCTVDIGFNAFGLIGGFYKAEKYRSPEGWGTFRWTKESSEVAIPWPGGCDKPVELVLRMNPCRPESVARANVKIFLDDRFLKSFELTDNFNECKMLVQSRSMRKHPGNRTVLRVVCNAWNPKLSGISGDTRDLGVQLDWIKVRVK